MKRALRRALAACLLLALWLLLGCSGSEEAYMLPDQDVAPSPEPADASPLPMALADGFAAPQLPDQALPAALRRGSSLLDMERFASSWNLSAKEVLDPVYGDPSVFGLACADSYGELLALLYGEWTVALPMEGDGSTPEANFMVEALYASEYTLLRLVRLDQEEGCELYLCQNPYASPPVLGAQGWTALAEEPVSLSFDQSQAYMSAFVQAHLPELELTAWASDYAYRCKLQRYTAEGPLSDAQYDEAQRQRDTHCLLFYHQYQGIPVEAAFWQLDLEGVWVSFGRNEGIISLMAGWHELLPEGETIEPLALERAMELAAAQHPGEQLTLLDAQLCYFNGKAPDLADELFHLQWKLTSDRYVDYVNCSDGQVYSQLSPVQVQAASLAQPEPAVEAAG